MGRGRAYPGEVTYSERLAVPARWWVLAALLVASFWLAMAAALPGWVAWLLTALAAAVAALLLLGYGAARVEVADGWLRAGRARIPVDLLGRVETLDAEGTRRRTGVDADARAFLVLRPYIPGSVRGEVTDPADPTPYWLVSTRDPARLARILAARGASPAVPGS